MRIRTRVKIGGALTFCILLAYGATVLHLNRAMTLLAQEARETNEIVNKITLLRSLTQDYLLYRTERAQKAMVGGLCRASPAAAQFGLPGAPG